MVSSLIQGRMARWLFAPADVTLTVDGVALPTEAYRLLVASTVPDVGMGFRVPWQAGREPGRFHLVASGLSTTSMALQLHRVFGGKPLRGAPHLDRLAGARPHPLRRAADATRSTASCSAPAMWSSSPARACRSRVYVIARCAHLPATAKLARRAAARRSSLR